MYIHIDKNQIEILEEQKVLTLISLWDTTDRAIKFYSKSKNLYTSYIDKPRYAYATPVKVFIFNAENNDINLFIPRL